MNKNRVILTESQLFNVIKESVKRILQETYNNEAVGDYYDSLPTDYAYRYGAQQEYDDARVNGFRSSNENPNYKAPGGINLTSKSGRKFNIRKTGQSHGGKAFSKGEPWKGSHIPSQDEVIMGVPGNQTQWKTGMHGSYSKNFQNFDDIEHGQPLWTPFDEDGYADIDSRGLRGWRKEGNGYREI